MLHHALLVFIVAGAVAPPSEGPQADAVVVYQCDFEIESDANYDNWPDGWTRRTGREYPAYLKIGIVDDGAAGQRCLSLQLDGGAATAYSPPIPVTTDFNYSLDVRLQALGLHHDAACVSLTFYDRERNPVGETVYSDKVHTAKDWRDVHIDVTTPDDDRIVQAVVGVHLRPETGHDLRGEARFDNVRLTRLPKMELRGGSALNLYDSPDDIRVACTVSGVLEQRAQLHFELFDVEGALLAEETVPVAGKRLASDMPPEVDMAASPQDVVKDAPDAFTGSASWRPPAADYGYYRVRASLVGRDSALLTRETSLGVLRPLARPTAGEFGWSLTRGDGPLSLEQLLQLLPRVGVYWVKFPLWDRDSEGQWAARFTRFCERLSRENVQVVGVLDQPPADIRQRFPHQGRLPAATVFLEDDQWPEALDPVVARHSLKIRWWQLGADGDNSFVDLPDLPQHMADIQTKMQRYGQLVRLGFACRWTDNCRTAAGTSWAFEARSSDRSLSPEELQSSAAARRCDAVDQWASLRPLPAAEHDVNARAKDLVLRMAAARAGGARRVFFASPLEPADGLIDEAGRPRELLLAWRTAAQLLAGSRCLGSIVLPGGSRNHVFARDGEAIMLVWNDQTAQESIYLGEQVEQVDIWGRSRPVSMIDGRQSLTVGPMPVFLLGVNEQIARWRVAFSFANERLESVFGRRQSSSFRFRNTFDRDVSGKVTLFGPGVWQVKQRDPKFQLRPGAEQESHFDVFLGTDASSGPQPVRFEFHVVADRTYNFSVYRTMYVGLGDIQIGVETHLRDDGLLEVRQRLTNNTDQRVSFNCLLYVPGRRRKRVQVTDEGRGVWPGVFLIEDGEELIGQKLWLRAEEIGGERILNYNFTARP